jgi:RNA polymerase sigma factor (sigma-70 family)
VADIAQPLTGRLADDLDAGFADLVRTHASLVYSVLLRQCGIPAEADDLGQETFLRAYTALRQYSPSRRRKLQPKAWLVTIAVNVWRSHLRDIGRRPVTVGAVHDQFAESADCRPGPAEQTVAADEQAILGDALAKLPDNYRLAVVLRHVVGLSYPEAAAALGCPEGTVKAQVSRGLASLRRILASQAEVLTA